MKEVVVPKRVTTIGDSFEDKGAFARCYSLKKVVFENNSQLTELGSYAFYKCANLKSVNLPHKLTSIGRYCFQYGGLSEI